MNILITGASGTVGGYLVDSLIKSGHTMFVLGRHKPSSINSSATFIEADIRDLKSLRKAKSEIEALDSIVHLAALVPRSKGEDEMLPMIESNVVGTANLLEVFGQDLKNFVYASTAEIYGLPESSPIGEDTPPHPQSYYGATKLAGEIICRTYSAKNQLPVAVLRFTVLYGPGDRINRAIPNFIRKSLANEALEVYGGEDLRDYLHVSDAAQSAHLAATKSVDGIFNIGTGKGISIKDTATTIANMINPDSRVHILSRQKKPSDIVLNTNLATATLGFTPKYAFPDLLDEQIAWHKSNQ